MKYCAYTAKNNGSKLGKNVQIRRVEREPAYPWGKLYTTTVGHNIYLSAVYLLYSISLHNISLLNGMRVPFFTQLMCHFYQFHEGYYCYQTLCNLIYSDMCKNLLCTAWLCNCVTCIVLGFLVGLYTGTC